MGAHGLKRSDLKMAAELKFVEMPPALCDNKIDAFVFVAGHPNSIFQDAANGCKTHIVPVAGPAVEELAPEGGVGAAIAAIGVPGDARRAPGQQAILDPDPRPRGKQLT